MDIITSYYLGIFMVDLYGHFDLDEETLSVSERQQDVPAGCVGSLKHIGEDSDEGKSYYNYVISVPREGIYAPLFPPDFPHYQIFVIYRLDFHFEHKWMLHGSFEDFDVIALVKSPDDHNEVVMFPLNRRVDVYGSVEKYKAWNAMLAYVISDMSRFLTMRNSA